MSPFRLTAVSSPSPFEHEHRVAAQAARLERVRDLFQQQADALIALGDRIDDRFERAFEILYGTPGHVIVSGMGKSGIIGQKIAATLASTGTPSFFVHPAEALHGDLGMITDKSTVLLLSSSGETDEIVRLLPHLKKLRVPVVSLVGRMESRLARESDVALDVSVAREVCPNNLAPTSSTLAALAMGDALAAALMDERKFSAQDFARLHPGGELGRRLCRGVSEIMQTEALPTARPESCVREALFALACSKLDILAVVDRERRLVGAVAQAELREVFEAGGEPLSVPLSMIMRRAVPAVAEDALIADAEVVARDHDADVVWVVNRDDVLVGAFDVRHA
ncbi:MAG: KpsF/GutQ family sugar-phosphate isomerase [Haliangiales bacterium]